MKTKLALTTVLASACVFAGTSGHHAEASQGITLQPHRAVYDVKLADSSDRSGISSMNGRIVYEFRGTPCDGYTTNFRFVTQIGAHGESRFTDQQTTTYEAPDGESFNFVTKTFINEMPDREVSGKARMGDGATMVTVDEPDAAEYKLGPALFPVAHMIDLLERAEKGERFYQQPIFDGSDLADEVLSTTVVIGPQKSADEDGGSDAIGDLADMDYRHVAITYFKMDTVAGGGEELPEYAIGFKMHANGVTRSLTMDYNDFGLEGTMASYEALEAESCE